MDIDLAPQRCQRLLLCLMRYNATPVYVPGKSLVVADTLSRSPLPDQLVDMELHSDIEAYVNAITEAAAQVGGVKMEQIQRKSRTDCLIIQAIQYTLNGWPKHTQDFNAKLMPFSRERQTVR